MARTRKPTQSEIDGVQYRRAKLWQIILYSCNAFVGMSVYSLIGYANYALGGDFHGVGGSFVDTVKGDLIAGYLLVFIIAAAVASDCP